MPEEAGLILAAAEEAKHSAEAGNRSENQRLFEERESELNSRHARELAAAEEVKHSAVAANHSETQRLFEERELELNSTLARELAAAEESMHSAVAANHSKTQRLFEERGSELNSTRARELAAGEEVKHSTVAANHSEKRPHDLRCPSETDDNACSGKYGTCCTKIDLWEANHISAAFTTHTCTTRGGHGLRRSAAGGLAESRGGHRRSVGSQLSW